MLSWFLLIKKIYFMRFSIYFCFLCFVLVWFGLVSLIIYIFFSIRATYNCCKFIPLCPCPCFSLFISDFRIKFLYHGNIIGLLLLSLYLNPLWNSVHLVATFRYHCLVAKREWNFENVLRFQNESQTYNPSAHINLKQWNRPMWTAYTPNSLAI